MRPAGSRSLTISPVAGAGPRLVSVTMNVACPPTITVSGETLLTRATSASRMIVTTATDSLSVVSGSSTPLDRRVVVVTLLPTKSSGTRNVVVSLMVWPGASVPMLHGVVVHVLVVDTRIRSGVLSTSTTTLVASEGPLFVMVDV